MGYNTKPPLPKYRKLKKKASPKSKKPTNPKKTKIPKKTKGPKSKKPKNPKKPKGPKSKKKTKKFISKKDILDNEYDYINNKDQLYLEDYKQSTNYLCYGIKYPKKIIPKTKRIFAIMAHSNMCSYNDLYNIRNNIEPRGFRLNLDKYKSNNVKNKIYISTKYRRKSFSTKSSITYKSSKK